MTTSSPLTSGSFPLKQIFNICLFSTHPNLEETRVLHQTKPSPSPPVSLYYSLTPYISLSSINYDVSLIFQYYLTKKTVSTVISWAYCP